jgi:hypothetical protein
LSLKERIFKKESLARYLDKDGRLVKSMGALDLIALGIGAVIGTGIFILPGTVAALHSGSGNYPFFCCCCNCLLNFSHVLCRIFHQLYQLLVVLILSAMLSLVKLLAGFSAGL